jgi:hypothetical protein
MLTLRRGIARVGWVFLLLWAVLFAAVMWDAPAPNPTASFATFVGVPLAVFLLWRLVLWVGQGFWQQPAAPMPSEIKEVRPENKREIDDEKPWARVAFGAAGIAFIAYGVHLGRLPVFPGFSGMLIYLGVFASIAQLVEWIWSSIQPVRSSTR